MAATTPPRRRTPIEEDVDEEEKRPRLGRKRKLPLVPRMMENPTRSSMMTSVGSSSSSSSSTSSVSSLEFNPSWNQDCSERPPLLAIATSKGEIFLEQGAYRSADDDLPLRTTLKKYEENRRRPDGINGISWSGEGTRVAVAQESGRMLVYDASRPSEDPLERRRLFVEDGACTCVCYTPQSNVLIAASYEGTIYMFDTRMRRMIRRISPAHDGPITRVECHPDGSVCLSAGLDCLVRVFDNFTGQCLATAMASQNSPVGDATFSPNGRYVLASTLDGNSKLWDLRAHGQFHPVPGKSFARKCSKGYWMSARFGKTSGRVFAGGETGEVAAWDVAVAGKAREVGRLESRDFPLKPYAASSTTTTSSGSQKSPAASLVVTIPLAITTSVKGDWVAWGGIGGDRAVVVREAAFPPPPREQSSSVNEDEDAHNKNGSDSVAIAEKGAVEAIEMS